LLSEERDGRRGDSHPTYHRREDPKGGVIYGRHAGVLEGVVVGFQRGKGRGEESELGLVPAGWLKEVAID